MFSSSRLSYLFIRLGLAAVFLWFGIDKMIHPDYWLNAWVAPSIRSLVGSVGLSGNQFVYLNGVFEILVGVSLVTNVLQRFFSLLAALFLVSIFIFIGFNEVTVRDIGLLGGFLAIIFWQNGNRRS